MKASDSMACSCGDSDCNGPTADRRDWTDWTDLAECAPDAPFDVVLTRLRERKVEVAEDQLADAERRFVEAVG